MRTLVLFLSFFLLVSCTAEETDEEDVGVPISSNGVVKEDGHFIWMCGDAERRFDEIVYEMELEEVGNVHSRSEEVVFKRDRYMDGLYCAQVDMADSHTWSAASVSLTPETREVGRQLTYLSLSMKVTDEQMGRQDQFAKFTSATGVYYFNLIFEPELEDYGPGPVFTVANLDLGERLEAPKQHIESVEMQTVEMEVPEHQVDVEGAMLFSIDELPFMEGDPS